MNKIFLIGNGFDLAHGLKTRYSDFLLWYINQAINCCNQSNRPFEDKLITIGKNLSFIAILEPFKSLDSFKEFRQKGGITLSPKMDFFNFLLNKSIEADWVNFEYEYFLELKSIYKYYERHDIERNSEVLKKVENLNTCLELIKDQLLIYLQTIKLEKINPKIENHFERELEEATKEKGQFLFLNFNYTDTIKPYLKLFLGEKYEIINIHGQLNDNRNPIIFGYGDEMNEFYGKIENLNQNEFLRNMKSFGYFRTGNYLRLNDFIANDYYTVSIMGHSCGISDRVLLSSIFCDERCKRIRIYFYYKDKDKTDYTEKTQEISRHFPLYQKDKMRIKIIPFNKSESLT